MSQARQQMTMRARVLRNENTGRNAYGEPVIGDTTNVILDALPCFAWASTDARENLDAAAAAYGDVKLSIPAGSDVQESDVIENIVDRLGHVIFDGPLHVVGVTRRPGALTVVARDVHPGGT